MILFLFLIIFLWRNSLEPVNREWVTLIKQEELSILYTQKQNRFFFLTGMVQSKPKCTQYSKECSNSNVSSSVSTEIDTESPIRWTFLAENWLFFFCRQWTWSFDLLDWKLCRAIPDVACHTYQYPYCWNSLPTDLINCALIHCLVSINIQWVFCLYGKI